MTDNSTVGDHQQTPTEIIETLQEAEDETVTLHFDRSIGWPLGPTKKQELKWGQAPHITTLTAEVDLVFGVSDGSFACFIEVGDDEMKRIEVYDKIGAGEPWTPELRTTGELVDGDVVWDGPPELVTSSERMTSHVAAVTSVERHGE